MSTNKRLEPELEEKLLDYIETCNSEPVNFSYEISEDGEYINLIATNLKFETENILWGISNIEKLLNVDYVNVTHTPDKITFIYKFKE